MILLFQEFSVWGALIAAVAGYLLGNLQTAIIISKYKFHDDVRNHGSGNAGTTNMIRSFGFKPGAVTFIGDFVKAALGVLAGYLLMGAVGGYIGGLFVVVGHCWPALAQFRGGKGVASSFAIAWLTFPLGAAITTAVWIVVFLATKRMSVMSLSGMLAFLVSVLVLRLSDIPLVCLAAALIVIVFLRHKDNIKRVLHGEEGKIVP